MNRFSEVQRRELIEILYQKYEDQPKSVIVKKLEELNIPRRTSYRVLAKLQKGASVERKSGSGRRRLKMPETKRQRMVRKAVDRVGVSTRQMASKFGISQSYVVKIMQEEGVKHYKRQKAPHMSNEQETRAKSNCRKLSKTFSQRNDDFAIVMDDESYFTLHHDSIPGNDGYFTFNRSSTPVTVKFHFKKKFESKIMVWLAISTEGISEPFFCPRRGSLDGEMYRKECIKKRLLPFLQEKHGDGNYVFWPDLASAHYAKETQELMKSLDINFVPRESNPPNVPQLRPIENFGGQLKAAVYANGWAANSERALKQRIKKCIRDFDIRPVKDELKNVPKKIRKASRFGLRSC